MSFTAREYRAIDLYASKYQLHVSLCQRPRIYFVDEAGVVLQARIKDVVDEYNSHLKEEARNRSRQPRVTVVRRI